MGLGTEEEEGYRTSPPGYIGWRNSFLGIDSGAPYTFKNTGSVPVVAGALYSFRQINVAGQELRLSTSINGEIAHVASITLLQRGVPTDCV